MDWLTTSTILDELRDFRNQNAWGQFADRFRTPLVSFARKLGLASADAEDVAQEILMTFAQRYRNGDYDPAKGRLSQWLFGIAYRQVLNARRRRGAAQLQVGAGSTSFWATVPDEQEASASWQAEWEHAMLERCLEQVRREVAQQTYEAFDMTVHGGVRPDEVAATLGLTRSAVYVAKHRVLKRIRELRQHLEEVL
ncbi:MAG: RNA polymerase sigma factor [Planctomycetota bacterium]|jgi:RNA polymerase sigma-70 factor (ECF subfamily)